MIVSCVGVPEGVPCFKEESFMVIGCFVNNLNIVKIKSDHVCVCVEQSLNSNQKSEWLFYVRRSNEGNDHTF